MNIQTLILTYVIISIICTFITLFLWYENRKRFSGMSYLLALCLFLTAEFVLLASRGAIPNAVSIVVANVLLLAGTLLGVMGMERFLGNTSSRIHKNNIYFIQIYLNLQKNLSKIVMTGRTAPLIFRYCMDNYKDCPIYKDNIIDRGGKKSLSEN